MNQDQKNNKKNKAIFLDRDGVINVERSYIVKPEDFEVFDFTASAIKLFNNAGYKSIVVTNQSAIARGMTSIEELNVIHNKLESELKKEGAYLDDIYFCPHLSDQSGSAPKNEYQIECDCRKPKPGMLLKAVQDYNIDMNLSYMIGDTERDILAGKNAGCNTVGVMTGYGLKGTSVNPDFFFSDLSDAANFLTNTNNENLFETLYKDLKKQSKTYIIGIGGSSCSGKSNLASFLKMRFEQTGKKVLKIELNNWMLPENKQHKEMNIYQRFGKDILIKEIEQILFGKTILKTKHINQKEENNLVLEYSSHSNKVIIIEGDVALSFETLRTKMDKRIFMSTDEKSRTKRIEQYCKWIKKNQNKDKSIYQSLSKDDCKLIEKDSINADIIIKT